MTARPIDSVRLDGIAYDATPTVSRLVKDHLSLVHHLVGERLAKVPAHVRRDDLTSAGMMALVLSAHGFDPDRGVPFARFAAIRIRGALMDELRGMDWAPRSLRCRARDIEAVVGPLAVHLGRSPYAGEVAAAMDCDVREIEAFESDLARATVVSLHALPAGLEGPSLPEESDGPETVLLRREQLGYLYDAVAALPDRLRLVIVGYFLEQRQMRDIAVELGVTQSRVSQMCTQALSLLRDGITSQLDPSSVVRPQSGRAAIARNAYLSAVAARGSLASRLAVSTTLGETIASRPTPSRRADRVA